MWDKVLRRTQAEEKHQQSPESQPSRRRRAQHQTPEPPPATAAPQSPFPSPATLAASRHLVPLPEGRVVLTAPGLALAEVPGVMTMRVDFCSASQ